MKFLFLKSTSSSLSKQAENAVSAFTKTIQRLEKNNEKAALRIQEENNEIAELKNKALTKEVEVVKFQNLIENNNKFIKKIQSFFE